MKTVQCECGEFIEVSGITVCKNCFYIHHSKDKKEINFRFYCPDCREGFNGLVPICPLCNEWQENHQKPVEQKTITKKSYQPLKFHSQPVRHVPAPAPAPTSTPEPKIENIAEANTKEDVKRKPTFLQNLILGAFCFDSGFTVGNAFKYAVIRKMMR